MGPGGCGHCCRIGLHAFPVATRVVALEQLRDRVDERTLARSRLERLCLAGRLEAERERRGGSSWRKRVAPVAHGLPPPCHGTARVDLERGIESLDRRREPERVQQRDSTL